MLSWLRFIDTPTLLISNGKYTWFELLSGSAVQDAVSSTNPPHPLPLYNALSFLGILQLFVRILVLQLFYVYKVLSFELFHQWAAGCSSPAPLHMNDVNLAWSLGSWLHLLLLFSWVDSLLQAHPAFPMKDLLLSEGVTAQEDSVWRNGGKSPLFPGKLEDISLLSLQCSR